MTALAQGPSRAGRSIGQIVGESPDRIAEIGGAWLVWQGTREHRGVAFIGAGIVALAAYGFVAARS